MLTFGPDGLSGHPDHIAIGQFVAQAFRFADDVIALYTPAVPQSLAAALGMIHLRAVPDEAITLGVDVSPVWESKLAAIRCHASARRATTRVSEDGALFEQRRAAICQLAWMS